MKITFTDMIGIDEKYNVAPAIKEIPEWYKKMNPYQGERLKIVDGSRNLTIKKCMPVFDSMTAGYIIKTYVDIYVIQKNGLPYYQWPYFKDVIQFHDTYQAHTHPADNEIPIPKWMSPWSIKTKRGYSCLFINPMHRENNIFTIFPGVVDTDRFTAEVNFPFTLNNKEWEGLIPAGTPIAQVIPFKRDSFKMEIDEKYTSKENEKILTRIHSRWSGSYKKFFWQRKQYL